jgi:hypothetical protein
MAVQDLSKIVVSYKAQSGLGTAASGASAYQLEVTSSSGLAAQVASIESALIRSSRMKKKQRQGSRFITASYETELMVGAFDPAYEGVLGGTWAATFDVTEADVTSVTIGGTGTTITAGGGSWVTEGIRAGMMGKFASLATAGNNGKWFPILEVTASVLTIASDILVDETADTAFTLTIAKSLSTTTPYADRYFTVEEYLATIDRGKLGTDMRFNKLTFDCQPDQPVKIGFGLGGRALSMLATGSSPNFTDPTLVSGSMLVLLEGGIYVNGTKRTNLTGFTFGLEAPVQGVPVIGTNTSPDAFLGQFGLTGQFTGVVEDAVDFDSFDAEDRISVLLHCAENESDPADFVSFYLGDLSFGGYSTPSGGEGATIQTIPLYGGEDPRGTGYAATTVLISTSAA